ncbi:MAG: peptidoglycan DD-metalloendopeptidase family protein, partial [Synergistaceae bacterium]|nr:peptidoglycan DD-metalloendopeptidase family protein [Synergistaceae bacterium]
GVTAGRSRSDDPRDAGNQVVLAPADGGEDRVYLSHLDSVAVETGDEIEGGGILGGMGNTGYTKGETGVHLDIKVKSGGDWIDPFEYFKDSEVYGYGYDSDTGKRFSTDGSKRAWEKFRSRTDPETEADTLGSE